LGLLRDEALAVAIYTYNEGEPEKKTKEFYFNFGKALRQTNEARIRMLKPYICHLMNGIRKLETISGVVFRGLPATALNHCVAKYRQGVKVCFNSFTSTSRKEEAARRYAGDGGIVFQIFIVNGRCIAPYSHYELQEDEVLLYPFGNVFVVTSGWYVDSSHMWYLNLSQISDECISC
jgi:hypothetical protein